jgi:hypothetical protein
MKMVIHSDTYEKAKAVLAGEWKEISAGKFFKLVGGFEYHAIISQLKSNVWITEMWEERHPTYAD